MQRLPKWKGPIDYSSVPNPRQDAVGPGREFNHDHKVRLREHNRKKNGGLLRSDLDGSVLKQPTQGSADNMQAEVDHKIPQDKGGPNTSDNAQILSKGQNRDKWDQ
jgi:5-methylcytosine-specific restriction endonuclease McrA